MNWAQIIAALFALGFQIAEAVQLDKAGLKAAVEKSLTKKSQVRAVMDAWEAYKAGSGD